MSTALAPEVGSLDLWTRFQEGRVDHREIARNLMLQRWSRCRRSGLSADNPGEPAMALAGLAEAIDAFAPLLAPGAPFDAFASALANEGFCGVLSDDTGRVLSSRIAEPFEASVVTRRLVQGAVWSEDARGTNGIGTTLFEQRPTAILGADHFERRNHVFACYGAPIRDVRERVVGVLDATGPASCAGPFIHASVVAAAAALEALIVGRAYDAATPGGLFALEKLLAGLPHAALIMESTGRVRRTNESFRAIAGDADHADLLRRITAPRPGAQRHPDRAARDLPRGMAVELEPIGDPSDPIASIVHLRERTTRRIPASRVARLPDSFASIAGGDPAIDAARMRAARFARTDMPMLVLGETGTGKDLFARAIHEASPRAGAPFIAVNAGSLTGTLLESELFGYAPGSFTGADRRGSTGKLAAADQGTLFLDEVGELSPGVQAMLLRFLESGAFFRVGESTERTVDVRIIAATHRPLPKLVKEGRFRSDLYFRLRGVVLHLPPLRQRTDRRELTEHLLARIASKRGLGDVPGLSPAALAWIERHTWPGNVRELRAALDYAAVMAMDTPRIELWHLPTEAGGPAVDRSDLRSSAEREALLRALDLSGGNLSGAARHMGVARSTLYRMLDRHALRGEKSDPLR
jgi:transcriptional regulator of acetoin/glycerol metabolism